MRKLRLEVLGNHMLCGGEAGSSHSELAPAAGGGQREALLSPPHCSSWGAGLGLYVGCTSPGRSWRLMPAEGGLWLILCPWVSGCPPAPGCPLQRAEGCAANGITTRSHL